MLTQTLRISQVYKTLEQVPEQKETYLSKYIPVTWTQTNQIALNILEIASACVCFQFKPMIFSVSLAAGALLVPTHVEKVIDKTKEVWEKNEPWLMMLAGGCLFCLLPSQKWALVSSLYASYLGHKLNNHSLIGYKESEVKPAIEIPRMTSPEKQLKKELAQGKSAREIMGFSEEAMAKFYAAANRLFESRRYVDSADAFLFLVTLNPYRHDYWLGLGMATQMCQNYEAAIDAYEMASICDIGNPIPYLYLAKCLFAIHDRVSALQALDLAIESANDIEEYAELKKQAITAKNILISSE